MLEGPSDVTQGVVFCMVLPEDPCTCRQERESRCSAGREQGRRRKVDEILATMRHDITAMETNFEEAKMVVLQYTEREGQLKAADDREAT